MQRGMFLTGTGATALPTGDKSREALIDAIQTQAFREVPTVPLGQFQLYNAYRKDLTGVVEAFGAPMWNIRRV